MKRVPEVPGSAVVFIVTTVLFGWWGLVAVGFGVGLLVRPEGRPGWTAAGGAAIGWAALLAWNATQGPTGPLASLAGSAIGLPGVAFAAIAVVFAGSVAGLSATVVGRVRRMVAGAARRAR